MINTEIRENLLAFVLEDGLLMQFILDENLVKTGPPLTITKDAIKEGTDIIEKNISLILKMIAIRHTGLVTKDINKLYFT